MSLYSRIVVSSDLRRFVARSISTRCVAGSLHDSSEAVDLSFTKTASVGPTKHTPLLILHGLFGNAGNWRSLCQKLSMSGRDVYAIDLRNHGASPHTIRMDYISMASDIVRLQEKLQIDRFDIIGHSMGGKVAMMTGLISSASVRRCVIVDIAPISYATKELTQVWATVPKVIDIMSSFPLHKITDRKSADEMMQQIVPDYVLRQFILQNLISVQSQETQKLIWKWRVNLGSIRSNSLELAEFSPPLNYDVYPHSALFLRGSKSGFIQDQHKPSLAKYFPLYHLVDVQDAAHWIHMEQPNIFLQHVLQYLDKN
eukprot:TRINITY_DN10652_c0_g1_i1.p1 TRINITY_DN10652_c0_g1~~TRINITY_DN10652_c0_g1_i1.p1  ORF type:complete len:313 (+),score=59.23 TRINITY_DN10652_c0_g1_i1:55-993(+)